MDSVIEYRPDKFEQLLQEYGSNSAKVEAAAVLSDKTELTIEDQNLCVKISDSKNGEKFQQLFSGNWEQLNYESQSDADFALVGILYWWTKDTKQIDRIFRQSGLYRPKWDEMRGKQTYGQLTIGNVAAKEQGQVKEDFKQPQPEDEPPTPPKRFRFVHIGELIKSIRPTKWLIEKILEAESLAVLNGDPGSYKSFLALDMVLCIATGTTWKGHAVNQGPVFIFIGEGHSGYGKRIAAWQKSTGRFVSDAPVFISTAPVQMLNPSSAKTAADEIEILKEQHGRPAVVLFDTLARNFGPGNESDTKDMSRFVATLDTIIGNDTCRLLVHHTGHGNKDRSRGSSALPGAVDADYLLSRQGDGVTLQCKKMKDAPEFKPIAFYPQIIRVGGTFDEPITSLYLQQSDEPIQEAVKLSPQQQQALSLLDLMTRKKCISCLSDWRELCMDEGIYTRTAFYNMAKTIESKNLIKISGDYVSLY